LGKWLKGAVQKTSPPFLISDDIIIKENRGLKKRSFIGKTSEVFPVCCSLRKNKKQKPKTKKEKGNEHGR